MFSVWPCMFYTVSESAPVCSPPVACSGELSLPSCLFSLPPYLGSPAKKTPQDIESLSQGLFLGNPN